MRSITASRLRERRKATYIFTVGVGEYAIILLIKNSVPFETNVFINCPFDKDYVDILRPILFCVLALGFEPRITLERSDSAETRIDKIIGLIDDARFGIHDLSRLRAKRKGEYFRLNMPFELGIDYACRRLRGPPWSSKKILILEAERYRFQAAISDLSGSDIAAHKNEPVTACSEVRNWLAQELLDAPPGPAAIWGRFNDFMADNFDVLTARGYSNKDIADQPIGELMDCMREWLGTHPAAVHVR